jgi:hypothetical protein
MPIVKDDDNVILREHIMARVAARAVVPLMFLFGAISFVNAVMKNNIDATAPAAGWLAVVAIFSIYGLKDFSLPKDCLRANKVALWMRGHNQELAWGEIDFIRPWSKWGMVDPCIEVVTKNGAEIKINMPFGPWDSKDVNIFIRYCRRNIWKGSQGIQPPLR